MTRVHRARLRAVTFDPTATTEERRAASEELHTWTSAQLHELRRHHRRARDAARRVVQADDTISTPHLRQTLESIVDCLGVVGTLADDRESGDLVARTHLVGR
jgi:hypothetical protein